MKSLSFLNPKNLSKPKMLIIIILFGVLNFYLPIGVLKAQKPSSILTPGFAGYEDERRERLLQWSELAKGGNPFIRVIEQHFNKRIDPENELDYFTSTLDKEGLWAFRTCARNLMLMSFACGDPRSAHQGREDIVKTSFALADNIIHRLDKKGGWWIGPGQGDPNINRFTMVSLLGGLHFLSNLPEFDQYFSKWHDLLWTGVVFHRESHKEGSDARKWDYGAAGSPKYPNMDAGNICILGLAAHLFDKPELMNVAHHRLELLHEMVLPGGGTGYMHETNEVPVYHFIVSAWIGLYYSVTNDPLAHRLLERIGSYLPTVLTAEADPEHWTCPHWKQNWHQEQAPYNPVGLSILASINNDTEVGRALKGLMWASLSHIEVPSFENRLPHWAVLGLVMGVDYWPGGSPVFPVLPNEFLTYDANSRGIRGRSNNWYYGVMKGRGQRNTFVGGIISNPGKNKPAAGIFRSASIHVKPIDSQYPNNPILWLSGRQSMDFTALSWSSQIGALGARYTLQPARYGSRDDLSETPWQVLQCWAASSFGIIGLVKLEPTENVNAEQVTGRIALGPEPAKLLESGIYECQQLNVKLFDSFGKPQIVTEREPWSTIEFSVEPWSYNKTEGSPLYYSMWIGPADITPPTNFQYYSEKSLEKWIGWTADWSNGRKIGVIFNPDKETTYVSKFPDKEWKEIYINGQSVSHNKFFTEKAKWSLGPESVMLLIYNP